MASILSKKQKKKREKYDLSDLKALGHDLLSSRAHINNLPLLLTFVTATSPPQFALESLLTLNSFFTPLLPQLPSSSSKSSLSSSHDDPDFIYRTWLRSKFDNFVGSLIDIAIASQSEQTLREVVLDTIMEFVKVGNGGKFHSAIYHRFLLSIIQSEFGVDDVLLDLLASKYFTYIDVRYFTYISLEKLTRTLESGEMSDIKRVPAADKVIQSKASMDLYIQKIHYILSHVYLMEASDEKCGYAMWNGSGIFVKEGNHKGCSEQKEAKNKQHKNDVSGDPVLPAEKVAKKMKLKFSKAWMSFLRLPLPIDVFKEVLAILHQAVIPHLSSPIMLCDFLTRSYDIGGVISVMALSSLYILMTQYGLEYPNFYEKLYALLEPSIFMAKYRAKFFELLDSCLKSPLLPAYLAAGFAKKLSRLALMVPPSGELIIIALIHNLLRRHPSINFLVHRENCDENVKDDGAQKKSSDSTVDSHTSADMSCNKPGMDHFGDEESNPIKTNAMRSSLWEVDTLRHHYCPPVSRFVLSLENDLTVRAKTTEVAVKDFSSGSYATIVREEIRRRVKQVPLAFYKATPTSLFSDSEFPGWTFKFNEDDWITDIAEHDQNSAKRQRIASS